uniref:SVWC domain-containing protein n=1 Tax=Steinernema glaseri TaxID=37863 RepID=A0A1I8AEP1_9BILA
MHVAFVTVLISSLLIASVWSGAVGKCRTECVELNKYKIVRVHLEEKLVHAGVCRNVSNSDKPMAHVFPFVCDRDVGKWTTDEHDEEGIAEFPIFCPAVNVVDAEKIDACP